MKKTLKPLFLSILACSPVLADPLSEEMVSRLSAVIHKHCPEARIESNDTGLTADYGTMMFTVHSRSKTGEIHPQTYQEEGPNFRGFILKISLKDGIYQGAAAVPQTLKGPYFPTYIDAVPAQDQDVSRHYWVRFSYGSRLDEKTWDAIFEAIPRTRFESRPPEAID